MQECFRWQTSLPTAVAHRLMEDDEYKGERAVFIAPNARDINSNWTQPRVSVTQRIYRACEHLVIIVICLELAPR